MILFFPRKKRGKSFKKGTLMCLLLIFTKTWSWTLQSLCFLPRQASPRGRMEHSELFAMQKEHWPDYWYGNDLVKQELLFKEQLRLRVFKIICSKIWCLNIMFKLSERSCSPPVQKYHQVKWYCRWDQSSLNKTHVLLDKPPSPNCDEDVPIYLLDLNGTWENVFLNMDPSSVHRDWQNLSLTRNMERRD